MNIDTIVITICTLVFIVLPICWVVWDVIIPICQKNKEKIKEFFINVGAVLAFISIIGAVVAICHADRSTKDYRPQTVEEAEDILDDPSWDIPSRYRN